MQFKKLRFLLTIICLSLVVTGLIAQPSSPYSRYGVGNVTSEAFAGQRAMAGVSAAYSYPSSINFLNPASYADLTLTSFEVGVNFDGVFASSTDSSYNTGNGSLSYIAFGFPARIGQVRWGTTFGLRPYSQVNYSFEREITDPNIGTYSELYNGKGSLHQVWWGNGFKYKGFSVGVNAAMMFGKIRYSQVVDLPTDLGAFNTAHTQSLRALGFTYNASAKYEKKLEIDKRANNKKDELYLSIGVYESATLNVNTFTTDYWQRFNTIGNNIVIKDTLGSVDEQKTKLKLPGYFGVGIGIKQLPNKLDKKEAYWFLGTDFRYGKQKGFSSPLSNDAFSNTWRLSIGGEVIPDVSPEAESKGKSFLQKTIYRAGFHVGTSPLTFNGEQFNEYGITFGTGLPIGGSRLNLTMEYSSRGTTDNNLLKENFVKVTAGVTLNDRWFIKRKFD